MPSFTSKIYRKFIVNHVFELIQKIHSDNSVNSVNSVINILDIGIGTGTALIEAIKKCSKLLNEDIFWRFRIYGTDVNETYLKTCRENITKNKLEKFITVHNCDGINAYLREFEGINFDFVLFSDSYAVIPNVDDLILNIQSKKEFLLKSTGKIIIFTTLEEEPSSFRKWIKPKLYYITLTEFGSTNMLFDMKKKYYGANFQIIDIIYFPIYGEITLYQVII